MGGFVGQFRTAALPPLRMPRLPPACREPAAAALVLAAAALLLFSRPDAPLLEPEEARYAEIPRQMLAADSWVVPVLHGQPYLDKPPLLYWLVMLSYEAFGVSAAAARLVPAVAAWLTVAVVYAWGRLAAGRRVALFAALLLALTPDFVYRGRMLTTNGLLGLWVTVAWGCGHAALLGGRRPGLLWALAGLATGLGVLTKGPVAVVLVVVPLGAITLLDRRATRPRLRDGVAFAAAALAVAGPWFLAMAGRDPGFLHYFFWKHHVERFVTPFDHDEPVWFYLPGLLLGLLPWTLLVPDLLRAALRRGADRPAGLTAFLLAFGWCLLFFSLSGCKRAVYLLPALPPLALALGGSLSAWGRRHVGSSTTVIALTFVALFWWANTFWVFGYADRFSLRGPLWSVAAGGRPPAVVCYPRRWDSVSFYLERDDVMAFSEDRRAEMVAVLAARPGAMLVVKTGHLDEVVRDLPPNVRFVEQFRHLSTSVGRVVVK
jgi:4-amino-4-deoxy-L-arabinose transferase-like glycosyltransferase